MATDPFVGKMTGSARLLKNDPLHLTHPMPTPKSIKGVRNNTIGVFRDLAQSRGGKCLSEQYINSTTKLRWRCAEGHEWNAIPLNVKRGSWCPICGNKKQGRSKAHTIEMMQRIAESRGGKCLSTIYSNNTTRLLWRCKKGHEWHAVPGSIVGNRTQKGTWCPVCAGKISKEMALEHLQEIASKRGGVLLSKEYKGALSKHRWRCAKGHVWEALADSVKRSTWCPACAGSLRLDLDAMHQQAAKLGGKCLSKKYINSGTPLKWECAEGHQWTAKWDHVSKYHWCPVCSSGVSERICRAVFEKVTGVSFPKQRPVWLKNDRGRQMELDGYATDLGIAFEYHGQQHYTSVEFFQTQEKTLERRKKDDRTKRSLCRKNGVVLIEIPHSVPHENLQGYISDRIRKTHPGLKLEKRPVDIASLDVWRRKDLEEMRQLARDRKGRLLSNHYINNSTKLKWRCAKGHEWEAVPSSVKAGTWCPKCGDKRAAAKRSRSIEEMQRLAAEKGGRCLSKEYKNTNSKLQWECSEGHIWETSGSVIVSGHWCPKCEKIRLGKQYALGIEEIRKTAEQRGGKCLSTTYVNSREKLLWQCDKGHKWHANTNSIIRGSWCPVCAGRKPKVN